MTRRPWVEPTLTALVPVAPCWCVPSQGGCGFQTFDRYAAKLHRLETGHRIWCDPHYRAMPT